MKNKNIIIVLIVLLAVGTLCVATITMKTQDKEENDYINPYIRKIRVISMFEQIKQPCGEICNEMQKIQLLDNEKIVVFFSIKLENERRNVDSRFNNVIHVYDGNVECRNNVELNSLLQENEKLCNAFLNLDRTGTMIEINYNQKAFLFESVLIHEKKNIYHIRFIYAIEGKEINDKFILEDKWAYEEMEI